jgi:hypothetical protein
MKKKLYFRKKKKIYPFLAFDSERDVRKFEAKRGQKIKFLQKKKIFQILDFFLVKRQCEAW